MKNLIKREPAIAAGVSVGALALVLVNLLAAFVDFTPEQKQALYDFSIYILPFLLPVVATAVARFFVSPATKTE